MFVPKTGPVIGATIRIDNVLVADEVTVNMPEVTAVTADIQAMGTMSIPIWPLLEDMEMTVVKVGVDRGFSKAISPGVKTLEVRFAQSQVDANGNVKYVNCKAFCKGSVVTIPSIGTEVGSALESEVAYKVTRYQLFVDGAEAILADRLAGKLRIDGKDLTSGLAEL